MDGRLAPALGLEPGDDLVVGLAVVLAVEAAGVDHLAVTRVREPFVVLRLVGVAARDHAPDGQIERTSEVVVALVVAGHGHDRAGAVLHEHVVGDEHRDLLAVDGVGDRAPQRDACLLALLRPTLLWRPAGRLVHVVAHRRLVLGARREALHVRVLGSKDEEGGAEEGVGAGGEDGEVDAQRPRSGRRPRRRVSGRSSCAAWSSRARASRSCRGRRGDGRRSR